MFRPAYLSLLFLAFPVSVLADDWPQWLGPQRDGVWRETEVVSEFPADGPKVLWRQPIGMGYAGPAVADGKIFVADRYLGEGDSNPPNPFDRKTRVPGVERVLCLDEQTGDVIWKHDYDRPYRISYAAGPRCTPTVDGDRVYTLGAMGDLLCLNVENGNVLWSKQCVEDYEAEVPVWGFAAHPLIDGDKLICLIGGKRSKAVIAFDKMTGDEIWTSLNVGGDFGYCPPMIYEVEGRRQLIIWHSQAVAGLDPETGDRLWSVPFEVRSALTAPTPRFHDGRLFVTSFYNGPLMLNVASEPPSAEILWRGDSNSERPDRTDKLHSIIATPYFDGEYIYGVDSYGELRCLRADTGERIWSTLKATTEEPTRWGNAFLIKHTDEGNRFFLFNERGELIIANLTPEGYQEIDRASIIEPTNMMAGRPVVWMHPAFANRCLLARNDQEIVRVSLEK